MSGGLSEQYKCRACGSRALVLRKKSNIQGPINSQQFTITNFTYGVTGELWQCQTCGLLQCPYLENLHTCYTNLVDVDFEKIRSERLLQARGLLSVIKKMKSHGRMLDIGTANGIFVEAALEFGYEAEGIEPSRWLQKQGTARGLTIYSGAFSQKDVRGPYDIITLLDVIEHLLNPKEILQAAAEVLTDDGIIVIVTPDANSFAAKILQWRWWHFRVAHVSYFNKKNLNILAWNAGLTCFKTGRPTWYFNLEYLAARVFSFFPAWLRLPVPKFLRRIIIPLNLWDSLSGFYYKRN